MFLVLPDETVLDVDLDLVGEVTALVDRHLEAVRIREPSFADAVGEFDRVEHLVGLGFAACQRYLTATYGFLEISKALALAAGPVHGSGKPVAELVNHAANYWKHHEEWTLDKNPILRKRVVDAFEAAGIAVDQDYPLVAMLRVLSEPESPSFACVILALARWRDEVRASRSLVPDEAL